MLTQPPSGGAAVPARARSAGRRLPLTLLVWGFAACVSDATPELESNSLDLPQGQRLVLDKNGLSLLDRAGQTRAQFAVRGKHLDLRLDSPNSALAVLLDTDTQAVRILQLDLQSGSLLALGGQPGLLAPGISVEALCLYRDPQALNHVFVVGKDGITQQWVFDGTQRRLLRSLSLPANTRACTVVDSSETLWLDEHGVGRWAYDVAGEVNPKRRLFPAGTALASASKPSGSSSSMPTVTVLAQAQTDPVARFGDAADDPAIWVHSDDAAASRVLGTNKKQGLLVYDLQGRQTQLLEVGRLNNVDLRQRVVFAGGAAVDLAVATQRDRNSVMLFSIDASGQAKVAGEFATDLDEIYGICLHQPTSGGLEVFVNDKDGRYQHHRLLRGAGPSGSPAAAGTPVSAYSATLLRRFKLASQPEACVVDDARGLVFMGEEKRGVWVMATDAARPAEPRMLLPVGPLLSADVEGLALYHGATASYLIVSSQGDNSYVVLDAAPHLHGAGPLSHWHQPGRRH